MRASGDNEIMAADSVRKTLSRQTCAPYMSVEVIPVSKTTMIDNALIFKMQSFTPGRKPKSGPEYSLDHST